MDVEHAIRGRRTHKVFGHQPLARETLDELLSSSIKRLHITYSNDTSTSPLP
jgi:hypothetical protein